MKIDDVVMFVKRPEDRPYLVTRLLDVSIRLFKMDEGYAKIVRQACAQLERVALMKFEDYPRPFGMSGANIGVPWNIIAYVENRDKVSAFAVIMINPHIIQTTEKQILSTSNCGSLRLPRPVHVKRYEGVRVEWYSPEGDYYKRWFYRHDHGFTIQHEIDHNLGILIDPKQADLI